MRKQITISKFIPGLQDILFFAIFFAVLLLGPRMLNMDGDLPKHLTIGKYVLDGNFPPINDIFSHTRYGTPFAPHKWLSGVFFYLFYRYLSEKGIILLCGVLLATTSLLIYSDAVRRSSVRLGTFLLVVGGAAVSSLHWIARPHLFTMFLLAIWLIWSERLASGKKIPLWYFPVLMLVWNNIHGEFIAGFLVTIACLGGWIWDFLFNRAEADAETGKRIGWVLLMITIVTLLNPVSFRAWGTLTNWMGNEYLMANTQETVSPNFLQSEFLILLFFLVLSIFLLAMTPEKMPTRMALILAGFTALTLQSARNVHIYGIVAPFILAGALKGSLTVPLVKRYEEMFARVDEQTTKYFWPSVTTLLGIILLFATSFGQIQRFAPDFFPVQAVEWLETHPQQDEMFNPFDWGGYLSLTLWPDNRVFIDSQGDVYGEEFIREYDQIITLKPGWEALLEKHNVTWAIVPEEWPLATALSDTGWKEIYRDQTSVILVQEK
jgi:hypothetical protein